MNKTSKSNVLTLANLQNILRLIKQNDTINGNAKDGYTSGKMAILELFNHTDDQNPFHLRARLGLIDTFYSTQMGRRYFGLDDLTDAILGLNKDGKLKKKFISFAKDDNPDVRCFDLRGGGNLWAKNYGIWKEGEEKGVAIALISKFAYFWTKFQFPIYDSIACEVIPKIWRHILGGKPPRRQVKIENRKLAGDETIVTYVRAINQLREHLGNDADFDTPDRLLWYTGKMMRGNYSLIFSKEDYLTWADVRKRKNIPIDDSIKHIDSSELPFLNKPENKHVKRMYELAKEIAAVETSRKSK